MYPISLNPSGALRATLTAFTSALRSPWKMRQPDQNPSPTHFEFRDMPGQNDPPASNCTADPTAKPSSILATACNYAGLLANIPILVVDDNPLHQQIAARILETAGATVTVASSGEQAILMLEREQYQLIIMDLLMPVMDGYAATRYIRNHLRLDTPVLALSADPTPGRRTRCLQAGMNDYLLKPVELSDLFERITRLLNRQASPAELITHSQICVGLK